MTNPKQSISSATNQSTIYTEPNKCNFQTTDCKTDHLQTANITTQK